jgi:hypothetical protein
MDSMKKEKVEKCQKGTIGGKPVAVRWLVGCGMSTNSK